MGGLVGHMKHIYELDNVQIADIASILKDIINNKYELREKIDGFNLQIGLNTKGQIIVARNNGDLNREADGMTEEELVEKYQDKPDVYKVFKTAIDILRPFLLTCRPADFYSYLESPKLGIRYMFNIECVVEGCTNLINYPRNTVIIHNLSTIMRDGLDQWGFAGQNPIKVISRDEKTGGYLIEFGYDAPRIVSGDSISLGYRVDVESNYIDFDAKFREFFGQHTTIAGYKYYRFVIWLAQEFPELFNPVLCPALYNYIFGKDNSRKHLRSLCGYNNQDALSILLDGRLGECKKYVTGPMIKFFADLEYEVLRYVRGTFNQTYYNTSVDYLYQDLLKAVVYHTKNGDSNGTLEEMIDNLGGKILPLEGVVFEYGNDLIKLTGTFVYLTRILGDYKYRKDK